MKLSRALLLAALVLISAPSFAQTTIPGLPAATLPLAGTELAPVWQSGVTKNVPVSALGAGITPANPTGTIGAAAVNGTATTYMRSDAAPALPTTLPTSTMPALTGDVTTSAGAVATTLATVNSNVGTFGDATHCATVTVNGKGLVTAASQSVSCPGSGGPVSVTSASPNIVITPTPGTGTFTVGAAYPINAQTGTSYTFLSSDGGKEVTFANASAIAGTLPQATGSFAANWSTDIWNKGPGTLTITPTTSTINGAATFVLGPNAGCSINSDGTNYQLSACTATAFANVWNKQQSNCITVLTISTTTFTPDGSCNNYSLTLTGADTLANPSVTPVAGTSGVIRVTQDGTGSRTISTYGSQYVAQGATSSITLSTAANASDYLSYYVIDTTHILITAPALNPTH